MSRFGVGTNVAATLLVATVDNANRLRKESSFAALCGVDMTPTVNKSVEVSAPTFQSLLFILR
ncbi:transposase [Vibrio sp. 10N.222.54.A1]|uniref:transposase n=1 Tax=Vibrio TaxID=662 RepID=UPI00354C7EEF